MSEFRLCYIEGPWAFFTSQPVEDQWGDDWNDAPYEHNAGEPYDDRSDPPKWEIRKVAFDCAFVERPCDWTMNSKWSVERINKGEHPWLMRSRLLKDSVGIRPIFAGIELPEFIEAIESAGGTVYLAARGALDESEAQVSETFRDEVELLIDKMVGAALMSGGDLGSPKLEHVRRYREELLSLVDPEQPSVDWLDPARESCLIDGVWYTRAEEGVEVQIVEAGTWETGAEWFSAWTFICEDESIDELPEHGILVPRARRPAPVEEEATDAAD